MAMIFLQISTAYGLQAVLEYIMQTYGNPPIYIQENGKHTFLSTLSIKL